MSILYSSIFVYTYQQSFSKKKKWYQNLFFINSTYYQHRFYNNINKQGRKSLSENWGYMQDSNLCSNYLSALMHIEFGRDFS